MDAGSFVLSLRPSGRSLAALELSYYLLRIKSPEGREGGSLVVSGLDLGLVFLTCLIHLVLPCCLCFTYFALSCFSCRTLFSSRLTFSFSMPAAGGR